MSQIAALALWMRAQRAFNDSGIGRDRRPAIRKTNIVDAEPMPGERDMLDGFLRSLREDRLESLMRSALEVPRASASGRPRRWPTASASSSRQCGKR